MVLSIQTLCSVFSKAPFWFNTAMSLFGKDATSFSHLDLGILCHSSLQILSSSVRLDGKRWWTAIFRSLQRCSIGFKSGLWLGHSRTVTELLWSHSFVILAVCLGSLSCWKVNQTILVWLSTEAVAFFHSPSSLFFFPACFFCLVSSIERLSLHGSPN